MAFPSSGVDGAHPILVGRAVLDLEIDEVVAGDSYTLWLDWPSFRGDTVDVIARQAGIHHRIPVENDAAIADARHQACGRDQRGALSLRDSTRSVLSPRCSHREGTQQGEQCHATGQPY